MIKMDETKIVCPFCGENTIKCLFRPSSSRFKRSRGSAISKNVTIWTKEKYIVVSGCSNCGKSKEEVEEEFKRQEKEGAKIPHEEVIRRAKEAGLPLKIKG